MTNPSFSTIEASYVPGPVEVLGRRWKMEYVGMASVYVVIAALIFANLADRAQLICAVAGTFFLFLGLKKKTRDHLSASFLLFAAALVARGPLADLRWAVPYLFFGICVYAMEGYLEKRHGRIRLLPLVFGLWAATDPSWVLGLLFVASYLLEPWAEKPRLRRELTLLFGGATILAFAVAVVGLRAPWPGAPAAFWMGFPERLPLSGTRALWIALAAAATIAVVMAYRRTLAAPRQVNGLLFAALAPIDARLSALFGLVAAVVLAATVFRQSIDSSRLRPAFKHAEWHFFWYVLAVAIWAVVRR